MHFITVMVQISPKIKDEKLTSDKQFLRGFLNDFETISTLKLLMKKT